jgi:hypothetical protein
MRDAPTRIVLMVMRGGERLDEEQQRSDCD